MRVLGKHSWIAYYFDPSVGSARTRIREMYGYRWGLLKLSGGGSTEESVPVVAVRIMGHDIDIVAEFSLNETHYYDLWEFFSEAQAKEIFDAAMKESSEIQSIVDSRLKLLSNEPSLPGRLSDADVWEGSGLRELGSGTVVLKVEITEKPFEESFDNRLGLALEGAIHAAYSDLFDSWFVYFINSADPSACERALADFGHKWSDEPPQVMLYLLGDGLDLQIVRGFANGLIHRDIIYVSGIYDHLDAGEYDEMIHDIESDILNAVPLAKNAVKDGIALLKQEPIRKKQYKLSDEDEWVGGRKNNVKFAVNYKVLGFGDL